MFSFALVRGQLSARAVCVAVGEICGVGQARAGAGNLGLDGGHVLGVWGFHGERKGEKDSGGVGSELLDIPLCASAGKGIRELYKLD